MPHIFLWVISIPAVASIFCNDKLFQDVDAVFLDKDGTLADVANYLSQLGRRQAQLMEQALPRLPGVYELTLKALGMTPEGLTASGLMAVGSRQETIVGTAAAAAIAGCPWVQAVDLTTATLALADQQCAPKAVYTPLLPGVLEFLKRLKQANLKVVMVSADSQNNLESFVQQYQLQAYFDHIQGVSSQHPAKTAPDFLLAACQAIGLLPRQGIVIGDSASDLKMADAARGFIGYLGGWQPTLSVTDILGNADDDQWQQHAFAKDFGQIIVRSD